MINQIRLFSILVGAVSAIWAQTPWDLQNCLANPANTLCTLGGGTYYISNALPPGGPPSGQYYSPIIVTRGNVTIDGQNSTLLSDASNPYTPLLTINFRAAGGWSNGGPGIKVQNITFRNPDSSYPGFTGSLLEIQQADMYYPVQVYQWQQNPGYSYGPYSVEVVGCNFYRAPTGGIKVVNTQGVYANDIYVHNSNFYWSAMGLYSNNDPYSYPNQNGVGCDTLPDYPNNYFSSQPRNIRIEHNYFSNAGQGALALNEGRWVTVQFNTFTNDAQVHTSGTDAGGIIFADQCSDTVNIVQNTITGPPASLGPFVRVQGLELWGRNIYASSNSISSVYYEGILARNTYNLQLYGNTIFDNNTSGGSQGGIDLWDEFTVGPPDYSRQMTNTTICCNNIGNVNTSYQAWGIGLLYTPYVATPQNMVIYYNNLSYQRGNTRGGACYYNNQPPYPYSPLQGTPPNPQGVSSNLTPIPWQTCW